METTDRLTFDEIAAIARLCAVPPPPYVASSDFLVESGLRSLMARGFFRGVDDDGGLIIASGVSDVTLALCSSRRFLVLGRAGSDGASHSGRIVMMKSGGALIEEFVYAGVVGVTPLDPAETVSFLRTVFGLGSGDEVLNPPAGPVSTVTAEVSEGEAEPITSPHWTRPELCSVMAVAGDAPVRTVQWALEGDGPKSLWLLDSGSPEAVPTAIPATRVGLAELLALLESTVDELRQSEVDW